MKITKLLTILAICLAIFMSTNISHAWTVRGTISAVYWYPTATVISVKTAEGAIVTREITPGAGSENQFLACILTAYSNGSEVLANVDGTNKYSYISME